MCVYVHAKALQWCPTLCNSMDCSPTGSSAHGDSPGSNTGVGCHALLQGIFPTQGWNLRLLHWKVASLPLVPPRKPKYHNGGFFFFKQKLELFALIGKFQNFKNNNKGNVSFFSWSHLVAQTVKDLPAMQQTQVPSWGLEDPVEKGMATHSSIFVWRTPRTEEPHGLLQSTGLQSLTWLNNEHFHKNNIMIDSSFISYICYSDLLNDLLSYVTSSIIIVIVLFQ